MNKVTYNGILAIAVIFLISTSIAAAIPIDKQETLGIYEGVHKYYIHIYNVDDIAKASVNGNLIAQTNYYQDAGWIEITGYLKNGANTIEFTNENTVGGWTYRFEIRQDDSNVIWMNACGTVGTVGCMNNDGTVGLVYRNIITFTQGISTAKRVGLQAGHYPVAGAPSCDKTVNEKDINWAVTNIAATILRQRGYTVDIIPAKSGYSGYKADVFIALHTDFCAGTNTGFKVSRYGGAIGTGKVGNGDASDKLVDSLRSEYGTSTGLSWDAGTGHYPIGFIKYYALSPYGGIAKSTPGAVMEMGWISGDFAFMTSVAGQQKMATGIANAVDKFTASTPVTTFSASGKATKNDGSGISGVTMTFTRVSGTGTLPASVQTGINGNWVQSGFQSDTTYRVTPSTSGYTFSPALRDFNSANTGLNFVGTPPPTTTRSYIFQTTGNAMQITIDGTSYPSPKTVIWADGTTHPVTVSSNQAIVSGQSQYAFTSWSGKSTSTSTSISIVASATTYGTYTANYNTQYYLTVNTEPSGLTSILGSGWYNSGTIKSLTAPGSVGSYTFSAWKIDNSPASGNPISVTMNGKHTATAVYTNVVTPNPTLSISQTSGIQGTTFYYTGNSFTPNGVTEWHVRKPDGNEYLPYDTSVSVNSLGVFNRNWLSSCTSMLGTYNIWAVDKTNGKSSNVVTETVTASASCTNVQYTAQFAYTGWMSNWVQNGQTAGTPGGNQMEAIKITTTNYGITYRAHVAYDGWQSWVSNGAIAGTVGQAKSLQAIEIKLLNAPSNLHVYYRAYVHNQGWQGWVSDGVTAGTTGLGLAVDAIEIKIMN